MNETIYNRFLEVSRRNARKPALMHRAGSGFVSLSYAEFADQVRCVKARLIQLGLCPGDHVGLFSGNRPEWAICDLAILGAGAVTVPIYISTPPPQMLHILNEAHIRILIVEHGELLQKVKTIWSNASDLHDIIVIEGVHDGDPRIVPFTALLKLHEDSTPNDDSAVTADDLATIVYTSGTTGDPSGVMLTHRNILANVDAVIERFRLSAQDVVVSYLPLCHMFERTCGYYAVLLGGGCIAYASSIHTVLADVGAIRPTVMIAVPLVLEKAFADVVTHVQTLSRFKQALIRTTMRLLNLRADRVYRGERLPFMLRVNGKVLDGLIASRFRRLAGGRVRMVACGGAPLERKIAKAFHNVGIPVTEGYGLTEASPVVCCGSSGDIRFGTVGKPLRGVEVVISPEQEILVRGPNVMRGYWNKPALTAGVIDGNGWLHTGDQGTFDVEHNLIVTGRIKDIIVTSGGKNVSALALEKRLAQSPYIAHAAVFGDRHKYIVALIVPSPLACRDACTAKAVGETGFLQAMIACEVARTNQELAPYEQIRQFRIIREEFSIANGMLTPTLKPRRGVIERHYREQITAMYEAEHQVHHV
jgi:long-chain acyl-CoA synthetase